MFTALNAEFGDFEDRPGGWVILDEPELRLGEDVLVPDIAGWRTENLPLLPATTWFDVVPDWVCDVLSPSTRDVDLGSKKNIYARDGVSHLWVVDPIAWTLNAFELSGGKWISVANLEGMVAISIPPFEAFENPLFRLWRGVVGHRSESRA